MRAVSWLTVQTLRSGTRFKVNCAMAFGRPGKGRVQLLFGRPGKGRVQLLFGRPGEGRVQLPFGRPGEGRVLVLDAGGSLPPEARKQPGKESEHEAEDETGDYG